MRDNFASFLKIKNKESFTNTLDGDFLLIIGTLPSRDLELLSLLSTQKNVVYLSVIEDTQMGRIAKLQSRYEAGSEEGVLSILTKGLLSDKNIDKQTKEYFDNLDEGYLSAECNIGEEEIEEIAELYSEAKKPIIIIGMDLYNHPKRENLANFISLLVKFGQFKIYEDLEDIKLSQSDDFVPNEVEKLHSFDGCVVYACPDIDSEEREYLFGSNQFMMAAKIRDNQEVFVITESGEYPRKFLLDNELKGTVALMPSDDNDGSYYYKIAKIIKREN